MKNKYNCLICAVMFFCLVCFCWKETICNICSQIEIIFNIAKNTMACFYIVTTVILIVFLIITIKSCLKWNKRMINEESITAIYITFYNEFDKIKNNIPKENIDSLIDKYVNILYKNKNDKNFLEEEYITIKSFQTKWQVSCEGATTELFSKGVDIAVGIFSTFSAFCLGITESSKTYTFNDAVNTISAIIGPVIIVIFIILIIKWIFIECNRKADSVRATFNKIYVPAFSAAIRYLLKHQNKGSEITDGKIKEIICNQIYKK